MPHLIQILLPLYDNDGRPFGRAIFDGIQRALTERFGGVTAYMRAPGTGLWRDEESAGESTGAQRDDVVTYEVMVDELDRAWWASYRARLERDLRQDEIVVRATAIERL